MRRGSSSLLIILALLIVVLAGAGAYLYMFAPGMVQESAAQPGLPTPLPDVEVVQAAIDIEAGTLFDDPATWLTVGNIPGAEYAASPETYITNIEAARGQKLMVALAASTPLRINHLGTAGLSLRIPTAVPGQAPVKAFPIQVNNLTGVADLIQPGDYVDVMASFSLNVTAFRPGVPAATEGGVIQDVIVEQASNEGSVKVLLQDVQVLDIMKPAPPQPTPEGGESAPPPPPAEDGTAPQGPDQVAQNPAATHLQAGNWLLIIAVTSQEAEVLRFALDRGIGISTLLRASGDHTSERTVGSTLRILVDHYGMPIPSGLPQVQHPGPVEIPNVPSLPQEPNEVFAPTMVPVGADQ